MNKQQKNLNAISSLQRMLTKENKAYMRKLHGYMILASAFHEQEKRATELLLSIHQDVLDAQTDGQSAEEFLGKDSKQMADELLSDLPPIRWYYGLRLTGLISLVYMSWFFLGVFGVSGEMVVEWQGLLCDLLIALILPSSAFFILKNLVYEPSKIKSYLMMGTWGVSFVVLIVLRFWISRQFFEGMSMPLWSSLLVILGIAVGLFYYRSKLALVDTLIPAYVLVVISGLSQVIAAQFGYGPQDWTGWLPLLFMVLAFFSTLAGTFFLLKKENMG
ncbi:hypothetical protein [Streptococcus suis]|uniref:Membrane protein n=1 Tax=Streptococcus suis TaxID=1307 RepID=A0A0Z8FKI2_STRSU|nr:hypothetical protein [Streptococcus suis]MCQ9224271.1 hypothetical protein [Streptococcus suis]MCQ9231072.1 hypothetical protein [Streptococcus suis]UUM23912.1 hypothetical protein NQZ84_02930 [Streptococcus suis]CYU61695.1 membrane protein [Streptococcus suis]CYU73083.1 membrane protein [Streptococcus suis]